MQRLRWKRRGWSPVLSVGGSVGRWAGREAGGGSCVPAHAVCALQGQGLGLVWRGRTGRAAEGGAVGGRGVTGGVRVLEEEEEEKERGAGERWR